MNAQLFTRKGISRERAERLSRLGLLEEPLGYVDGANLYEYVMSNPSAFVDPMGLDAAIKEAEDDNVGKIANAAAGTTILGGFIYVQLEQISDSTTRTTTGPACYRVKAVYDHLDIWTGYVSVDFILKKGGVSDPAQATDAQRLRAKTYQQQALNFERTHWQSRLKDSWEDGIKAFTKAVMAIEPGKYDKVKEQVQTQLNALGTTISAEWQKVEQADFNLRRKNANKGRLRVGLGQKMWNRVATDIGLAPPATQPTTQPVR